MVDELDHVNGMDAIRWSEETRFGSGVAKAIVWRILTGGGMAAMPLDYEEWAAWHEFSVDAIRVAVARMVTNGHARIVSNSNWYSSDGPVLELMTPGRHALDAALAAEAAAKEAERLARIARAGGREQRAPIPKETRDEVYARDGYACVKCGATDDLTLDHIHPWSLGGPDTADNLRVLCRSCNSRKSNRIEDTALPTGRK